jgi:hypothetical protein
MSKIMTIMPLKQLRESKNMFLREFVEALVDGFPENGSDAAYIGHNGENYFHMTEDEFNQDIKANLPFAGTLTMSKMEFISFLSIPLED